MSFFPRILLFQQPFFYNFMYIVLPLLDTLTGTPIYTLCTHIHTHIWICTAGMWSVTMVYLYICVCLCMSVRCVVIDPSRLRRHSYMSCIHTKNVLIWMTKTTSLFSDLLFWVTSLPFE